MRIRIKKVDFCPKFPYKVQIKKGWFRWETKCHCATKESAENELNRLKKKYLDKLKKVLSLQCER